MAKVLYEISAPVETYEDRTTGERKTARTKVGVVMQSDNGNPFILIDRTFNPAGALAAAPQARQVLLALFKPQPQEQAPELPPSVPQGAPVEDEDIPF